MSREQTSEEFTRCFYFLSGLSDSQLILRLSRSRLHLQGLSMAKQLGAETYLECSAFTSEKSIHSVFRTAALACMDKLQPANKPSPIRRLSKRFLHLSSRTDLISSTFSRDKSKGCTIM